MNALVIDCAVSRLTVACKKDTKLIKLSLDVGTKQSEKILPAIDYVMKEAELCPKDLDWTACTLGPGTFTGLRLGLSALKALTLANGTPLYGIKTLQAYANNAKKLPFPVISVLEAKENEYFYSIFENNEQKSEEKDEMTNEIAKNLAEKKYFVFGPSAKKFISQIKEINNKLELYCIEDINDCTESLLSIGEEMAEKKEPPLEDYDGPFYVRKSEAELMLENKK